MKVLIYLFIISFLQSYSFDNTLKNENLLKSSSFESRNNPFIALALSAVLPGAGQIYNKNYKRGIAYLAIELINIFSSSDHVLPATIHFLSPIKSFMKSKGFFSLLTLSNLVSPETVT